MTAPSGWRTVPRRLSVRLVAAILAVSLPLMVGMAVFLTASASTELTAAAERSATDSARAVAQRVTEWLSDRRGELAVVADGGSTLLTAPATARTTLSAAARSSGAYSLIQVFDGSGRSRSASRTGAGLDPTGQAWFRAALGGARRSPRWSAGAGRCSGSSPNPCSAATAGSWACWPATSTSRRCPG